MWSFVPLWLGSGLAAMVIQAKGYDYHWLPTLVPLVILAADALAQVAYALRTRYVTATLLAVILAQGFADVWFPQWDYLNGAQSQQSYYDDFRGGEYLASESQQVVDYLRARTTAADTLFIYGFRAEVYYLTGLRPATRFIFNFPIVATWYPQAWRDHTTAVLWQEKPPYAIIMRGDYMPWVTGCDLDSQLLLMENPDLRAWLEFNYERDVEIGNFLIWRLKPPSETTPLVYPIAAKS